MRPAGTMSMLTREEQEQLEIRDDIWIRWTGTGGTFEVIKNGGFPVFPIRKSERTWLSRMIEEIYDLPQFKL